MCVPLAYLLCSETSLQSAKRLGLALAVKVELEVALDVALE